MSRKKIVVVRVEEMDVRATKRRCNECTEPAVAFAYQADNRGGVDRSSRRPVCSFHERMAKRGIR